MVFIYKLIQASGSMSKVICRLMSIDHSSLVVCFAVSLLLVDKRNHFKFSSALKKDQ